MFPTTTNTPDIKSLAQALTQSKVNETPQGGEGGFLKFDFQAGDYLYGREQEDVTGDHIIINPASIAHGWVLWHNRNATKRLVPFTELLPEPMEGIGEDEPSEGRAFAAAFITEDMSEAEQLRFETNSYGGRQGVDTLLGQIKTKAMSGSEYIYPECKLSSNSYQHSKRGNTIHNPVFELVNWRDMSGNVEPDAAPKIEEDKSEPAKEEAKPKRRRVRRKA